MRERHNDEARRGARGWKNERGGGEQETTEGEKREIELSARTTAGSTEKAAGVGWMDFQPRIDNNCLNQARLSRPLPPPRSAARGGGGTGEGGGLKTKRKTKEHPVRRIAPSMAYLHPLGCATTSIQGRLPLIRASCRVAFTTSPSLSLSSNSTRGSIITDTSTWHASFSSRYFRNDARD